MTYPFDYSDGVDCGVPVANEWCRYPEPHVHGFACDETCPCRLAQS